MICLSRIFVNESVDLVKKQSEWFIHKLDWAQLSVDLVKVNITPEVENISE